MSLQSTDPRRLQVETPEAPDGFLARWSRRKLGTDTESGQVERPQIEAQVAEDPVAEAPVVEAQPEPEPIDPRTGKPMSELTDEDMPAIELLNAESDLRCFMSGKVSQALRMKALTRVFHSPKYNQMCICAEYADDYTNFLPMGDIVPHDLKQAIAREAGKLLQRLAAQGFEMTSEDAQARVAREFRGEKLEPLPIDFVENDVTETLQSPPIQQTDDVVSSVRSENT
jgi:hypothetical protein